MYIKHFNILAVFVVEFIVSTINKRAGGQTVQVQQTVFLAKVVIILHTVCTGGLEKLTPGHLFYSTLYTMYSATL